MCSQHTDETHQGVIKDTSVALYAMGALPLPLTPLDVGCVMWAGGGRLHPSPGGPPGTSVSAGYFPCLCLFQGYLTALGTQLITITTL